MRTSKQITNSKITIPESNLFGGNRAISSLISIKLQVYHPYHPCMVYLPTGHESQHHPTPFMGWFVFFFQKTPTTTPTSCKLCVLLYKLGTSVLTSFVSIRSSFEKQVFPSTSFAQQVNGVQNLSDIPLYCWITVIGILIVAYYNRHKLNGYHPLYYVYLKY